jgi:hypothetical protein
MSAVASPPAPKLLLTQREAALALSVSERNLWDLTKRGLVPCVRVGRRGVRYSPLDLQAYIDAHRCHKGEVP